MKTQSAGVVLLLALVLPMTAVAQPWLALPLHREPAEVATIYDHVSSERLEELRREGHAYVQLLHRRSLHVDEQGELTMRSLAVRYYLSDFGVQQHGNLELAIDAARETVAIERAYTISPAGEVAHVEAATIQSAKPARDDLFSDWHEVTVPLRNVEVGSLAVFETVRRSDTRDWPLPWDEIFYLQWRMPIERQEFEITWAGDNEIDFHTTDSLLRCESAEQRLSCYRGAIDALALDEDVRSYHDHLPYLIVGHPVRWATIVAAFDALLDERTDTSSELRNLANELVSVTEDPRERFRKIHRFVADQVRYVGLEHGVSAIVPERATTTLQRRFGDCKGKVVLFTALAEAAGIAAYPVLTSTMFYDDERIGRPSMSYFDHMIVCADLDANAPTCVDPTVPLSPLGLPPALSGALALALRTGRPAELSTLPSRAHLIDVRVEQEIELHCSGATTTRTVRRYAGSAAMMMRAALRPLRGAERTRWAEDEYREANRALVPAEIAIRGVDDPGAEVVIETLASEPLDGDIDENRSLYYGDPWLSYFGSGLLSENRIYPYAFGGLRYRTDQVFRLCERMRPKFLGARLEFESTFGVLRREYEATEDEVRVQTTLDAPSREIPVSQLPRLKSFLENSLENAAIWFSYEARER